MKKLYNKIYSRNIEKPYWEDRIEHILNFVGSEKKVLDIGCGHGLISFMLKKNENAVVGLDISRRMVLETKKRGIKAYQCDIETDNIPTKDKFDIILMTEVLEHLIDPIVVLKKIKKSLKNNGFLYITTPNCAYWYNRLQLLLGKVPNFSEKKMRPYNLHHKTFFDINNLKKTIEMSGLKITKIEYYIGFSPKRKTLIKVIANFFRVIRPFLFASNFIVICKK